MILDSGCNARTITVGISFLHPMFLSSLGFNSLFCLSLSLSLSHTHVHMLLKTREVRSCFMWSHVPWAWLYFKYFVDKM